jgi:hypothetical protein
MLPDFPKTRSELEAMVVSQIKLRANEIFVVTKLIQEFTQHEGRQHQLPGPTGEFQKSEYESVGAEVLLKPEAVRDTNTAGLAQYMEGIASDLAKKHSEAFYRVLDKSLEQGHNSVGRLQGLPTQEEALELVEKIDWSPNAVFVAHPDMAKQMGALWEDWKRDRTFMKKHEEIQARKKEEFRARESNRKLVS